MANTLSSKNKKKQWLRQKKRHGSKCNPPPSTLQIDDSVNNGNLEIMKG